LLKSPQNIVEPLRTRYICPFLQGWPWLTDMSHRYAWPTS